MKTRRPRTWNDVISDKCDAYAAGDDSALDEALSLIEAREGRTDDPILPVPDAGRRLNGTPPAIPYMNIQAVNEMRAACGYQAGPREGQ